MDDDFLRSLEAAVADAVASEAARERAQERTLRSIASAEGTLVGVLVDLAERSVPVVVRVGGTGGSGRTHRGRVLAVARDAVVLRDGAKPPVVVALAAVASVRPQPFGADVEATGARPAPLDVSMAALLAGFSASRPRVQVVAGGDEPVAGELRAVGLDVLTLRLDGDRALVVHVPLGAVQEVVLLEL